MVHLHQSLPILVFVASTALHIATIAARPLPFEQEFIEHTAPRTTYVKSGSQRIHTMPARIMIKMKPEKAAALRGSTLATRQAAEAKKDADNVSSEHSEQGMRPLLYASTGSDTYATGWKLKGSLPVAAVSLLADPLLASHNSPKDKYGRGTTSQPTDPSSTLPKSNEAPPVSTSQSGSAREKTTGPNTSSPTATILPQQKMVLESDEGSSAFPVAPPIGTEVATPPNEGVYRVTVVDSASRAKANTPKKRSDEGSSGATLARQDGTLGSKVGTSGVVDAFSL